MCSCTLKKTVWSTVWQVFVLSSQRVWGKLMKHVKVLTTLSSLFVMKQHSMLVLIVKQHVVIVLIIVSHCQTAFWITCDLACPRCAQRAVWSMVLQVFALPSQRIWGKLMKHIKVLTTLLSSFVMHAPKTYLFIITQLEVLFYKSHAWGLQWKISCI